jgi:hypothetical protein
MFHRWQQELGATKARYLTIPEHGMGVLLADSLTVAHIISELLESSVLFGVYV